MANQKPTRILVLGGGFAGLTTVAELERLHSRATPLDITLVNRDNSSLFTPMLFLPELGDRLGGYAREKLGARGVEIVLRTMVTSYDGDVAVLSDGQQIATQTLIWTAGNAAHPLVSQLPCGSIGGRVNADACFQVQGHPGVWALGDCVAIPNPDTRRPYPPTAQHTVRQGRVLARNLVASVRGAPLTPFRFATLGLLAAIGRRTGVANVLGVNFSGFTAWFLWRTIYLGKLPRLEKKLRVMPDWTLDLRFDKDLVQFETRREAAVARMPAPASVLPDGAREATRRIAQPA